MDDNVKKSILSSMISGDKFSLGKFVAEIQSFCLGLRLEHWKTTSYELHKAVEATQASLEGLLDDFVEACQGMTGGDRAKFEDTIEATLDEEKIINCLKNMDTRDTTLLNIRDEMLGVVYKFKYLKTLK